MRPNVGTYDKLMPLLDHGLAGQVCGVRLTSQYQLDRMLSIRQDASQPFGIVQQKIGSLVSGEAPGKSHRKRVKVEDPLRRGDVFRGRSAAR